MSKKATAPTPRTFEELRAEYRRLNRSLANERLPEDEARKIRQALRALNDEIAARSDIDHAPTGMATRPDGINVEVTIPPREESEGAAVVRLADEVIAAANQHRPENAPYVREDLTVTLCIAASGTTWKAELGRARVDGCRSAEEALTALRTIVARYPNTTSEAR